MAKENKLNPYALFTASVILLVIASFTRSFPLVIFAALAPLFAISDHANENNFWNKLELIGVALTVGILAWFEFDLKVIVAAILIAMAYTLSFGAYTFSRNALGSRFGKLPLILFWLATEYVLLKLFAARQLFFLADTVYGKPEWLHWTASTGYLGASLWILSANLLLYLGVLRNGLRWPWLVGFVIVIVGPILYSYIGHSEYVTRLDMQLYYMDDKGSPEYRKNGEWVTRSAAWVSVLILLSALVKGNIKKK
jgi:apolipoprotein N-acyltransferase